jgi:hypothetical protein
VSKSTPSQAIDPAGSTTRCDGSALPTFQDPDVDMGDATRVGEDYGTPGAHLYECRLLS